MSASISPTGDYSAEQAQAIQAHLGIVQLVIQRMAANSASSKTWCITLVSAILLIVFDKDKQELASIAAIPTVLFFALDAYYLALEKRFRECHGVFIKRIYDGTLIAADIYDLSLKGRAMVAFLRALMSFSVWPFYLTLFALIWIAMRVPF